MIYCPGCGTANRDGSRFCNECGTKLPTMTSSLCSVCGTPNPPHSLFCEKCGARLVASLTEEPEDGSARSGESCSQGPVIAYQIAGRN
jgi:predicted amidophosphoribosyltransferase